MEKDPPHGGRWMRDPETGELTPVNEDEVPVAEDAAAPEPQVPEAAPDAPARTMKRK